MSTWQSGLEADEQGMHSTSTAGIFGTVASTFVLNQLKDATVEMAFAWSAPRQLGLCNILGMMAETNARTLALLRMTP